MNQQSDVQEYSGFYNSVNSYDGASVGNGFDYMFGGPDDGRPELTPGGPAGKVGGTVFSSIGKSPAISQIKKALLKVYKKLGIEKGLPKMKKGKYGSPQRGTTTKGYRYDKTGHPKSTNPNEKGAHINWWDYTKGNYNKGKGPGKKDAIPFK
jgi:hypothetical protein